MNPIANHPGQKQVWYDKSRFKILVCGRRWGKTYYAIEKMINTLDQKNKEIAYVAPTRQQAKDVVWNTLKARVKQLGWRTTINETELKIIRVKTKSSIRLYSGDAYDRMRGKGFDLAAIDEFADMKKEAWTEVLRPALSDRQGHATFLSTPKSYNHFYDMYQEAKTREDWSCYSFKTIDSPFFQTPEGKKEIEDARRDLDERTFRQEYEASFESFSGRICYSFDRHNNNVDYTYISSNPVIVGMDFNVLPMSACLFQMHNGQLIQFAEVSLNSSSTDEMCRVIKQKYPAISHIARPDAAGNNRSTSSSKTDFAILREHGFKIEAASRNPARVDRWASQNRAFEKQMVMVNVKNCPKTVKDLETLCYKEGTCEPDLKGKLHGHLFDAQGYAIYRQFPIIKRGRVTVTQL